MGQFGSKPCPIEQQLRNALYNKDRDTVAALLEDPRLEVRRLPIELYVELPQRHWAWNTVEALCKGAALDNMVALLSAAVLSNETYPYHELFRYLQDAATREGKDMIAVLDERKLRHLFLVACHKQSDDMADAFLDMKCFVPTDSAPLRFVFRREMSKRVASPTLVRRILSTHRDQFDAVVMLRSQFDLDQCKKEDHKELLRVLDEYMKSVVDTKGGM